MGTGGGARRRTGGRGWLGQLAAVALAAVALAAVALAVRPGGPSTIRTLESSLFEAGPASPEAPPLVPYPTTNGWMLSASVTAAGTNNVPAEAADGQIATRWTTGAPQKGTEQFLIDLGKVESVSEVVLDDSSDTTDFPVSYKLEASTSTDSSKYVTVATGKGAVVTTMTFPDRKARYLRITDTGTTTAPGGAWWSIDELRVYP